jgi:hypothetical protein
MKAVFTTLLAIACAVILIWGNIHWNQKSVVSGSNDPITSNSNENKPAESKKIEKPVKEEKDFSTFTQNWPEEARSAFNQALDEKRTFKLLIVGSGAVGEEPTGWAYQVKKEVEIFFGSDVVSVNIKEVSETTLAFIQNDGQDTIAEEQADLILFEPFTLTDNGLVLIEDSLANIQTVIDTSKESNPNTVFILQPPNPIYQPKLYLTQVEALEEYAAENNIAYLDHWEAWPDTQSEEIYEYLEDGIGQPNEEGHKIWGKYVVDYLISK